MTQEIGRRLVDGEWVTNIADESAGGGSQPVACVLARDAAFDIRAAGNYDVLWDALYDNFWDLTPLVAIPAGLGLDFDFDGSSSLVVPTEAGFWTLSYFATRDQDIAWAGSFVIGIGINLPWLQEKLYDNPAGDLTQGTPYMAGTLTTPLPAGAQLTHQVATAVTASAGSSTCTQVYLSIVRHA